MSSIPDTGLALIKTLPRPAHPPLRAVVTRAMASLATAVLAPTGVRVADADAGDHDPVDSALAAGPRIRRLFRRLTLLWGLVIVVKATVTLWLLLSLPTVHYVLVQSSTIVALMLAATAATVALSAVVGS